ncbi:MAG: S8 family serine peptidase [Phycisphaerales bacterium]
MPSRRLADATPAGLALAAGLVLTAHAALAQPIAGPVGDDAQPVRATLATGLGTLTLDITRPDAPRSDALAVDRVQHKPSPEAPARYTLTDRVIIRATDAALDALRRDGFSIEPSASVPGYAFVTAGSVRSAIELAPSLAQRAGIERATVELGRTFRSREVPNDPSIPLAWHLLNTDDPGHDINAVAAWARGYTGEGVTIGIVDEGVFNSHEDLLPNLDLSLIQSGVPSGHGTSVAGIAVAAGNNGRGAAGLAYNATFGPQVYARFAPTEQINADALAFRIDAIDIKNNSWGPLDNRAFHPLDPLEADALELGATTGRGGLGTVYVWAAGNGNIFDRPEYDGFAGSRHTIAIGAVGHLGVRARYNERGSAMMAVTYSDGNDAPQSAERDIFTTRQPTSNNPDLYTEFFGGTSAAAPLATGAVALVLEANPALTARDVQHLVVQTAKLIDPGDPLWTVNAAGRRFNDNYGFGALDAGAMVIAAETWTPVGPAVVYDAGLAVANAPVPDNNTANPVTIAFQVPVQIKIEHAEITVRMLGPYIGDIQLELVSPSGTVSTLAETRTFGGDDMDHTFTTVKHWDERSAGLWTLRVADGAPGDEHTLLDAHLVIHGTCLADQDRNGAIDAGDFQAWLANYQNESRDADLNGDGGISPADFSAWVAFANIGC